MMWINCSKCEEITTNVGGNLCGMCMLNPFLPMSKKECSIEEFLKPVQLKRTMT